MSTINTVPTLVLDTNVVLDWLVFHNPAGVALGAAVASGAVRWLATDVMREELRLVLARGHLARWEPDETRLWVQWDRFCMEVKVPGDGAPGRPRCSDVDDQKFIDLAIATRADWLISRDRAVLKLARRLRAHGVEVAPPEAWQAASTRP